MRTENSQGNVFFYLADQYPELISLDIPFQEDICLLHGSHLQHIDHKQKQTAILVDSFIDLLCIP